MSHFQAWDRSLRFSHIVVVAVGILLLPIAPNLQAQETIGTSAPTSQSSTIITPDTAAPTLSPASDSNLPLTNDLRTQVSAEPRRFHYQLQISVRGVYDDNININQTNRVSDYYFAIEPTLTLGVGDINGHQDSFLRFDYFPGLFLFLDHSENDALQHVISLQGQHQFSRLTLALTEQVAILDGTDLRNLSDATSPGSHANLDVSGRTKFQTYNTHLYASYDLSGKTFLSTEFYSLTTNYNSGSLFSSANLSENLFINYRYSDKLVFGVGGTGGYDFVEDPNPGQTFEQANVRMTYQATGKINLNLSGGVEFRQFENDSRSQYISPVFDFSASYQPSDGTTFAIGAGYRIYNSAVLVAQNFTEATVDFSVHQRFLQRFYVAVVAGYQHSDYFSTVSGLAANRKDDYYYVEPGIDFSITRFWTCGGYYLDRQNESSVTSFSFDDNQVGIRTALTF